MHRSNTDGNNFEAINSEEIARSGATEVLDETSRLNVKRPEQDSFWQSDIPQLSNDGLVWSGTEASDQDISISSGLPSDYYDGSHRISTSSSPYHLGRNFF